MLTLLMVARLMDPGMALADIDVLPTAVSGPSPFATCMVGGPGTVYDNAEVEPYLAVNPATLGTARVNLIGVWQQDRWADGGAHGLVAGSSLDGGRTWRETPLPFDACAPGGLDYDRASDPWISIGPDGTAYAVAIASSTDGGSHWTRPRPVYRRPVAGFTPSVAVDVRGEVGVSFYDLRHDTGQSDTLRTDYWLTISSDGGRHFNRETHLGGPFNLRLAPNAGGLFLGDYQGLAAAGNVFHAFFVMVNDATPDNATDVFALAIVTRKPA